METPEEKIAVWRERIKEYSLLAERAANLEVAKTYRQLAKNYQALILYEERMKSARPRPQKGRK